jgi:hypothetical protein
MIAENVNMPTALPRSIDGALQQAEPSGASALAEARADAREVFGAADGGRPAEDIGQRHRSAAANRDGPPDEIGPDAKRCEVLGRTEVGAIPRFATNGLRVENKPALLAILQPILGPSRAGPAPHTPRQPASAAAPSTTGRAWTPSHR